MKQKDVILIIAIVIGSAIVSLFVSRSLFVTPADRQQQVEVVQAIDPNFPTPDVKNFNALAIDPTQLIQIGGSSNPNPFNGSQQ